jgi:hypothetical protein
MVKNFTILGERCSGTNYLEELMLTNFDIGITWKYGEKHGFGHYKFTQTKEAEAEEDETLFIGMVRHPVQWLHLLLRDYCRQKSNTFAIDKFLINKQYSISKNNEIIKYECNYITGNKYKDVFELRSVKNNYLMNNMFDNVNYYTLIKYEMLRDNTEDMLRFFQTTFKLKTLLPLYKNILYYKKEKDVLFYKTGTNVSIQYKFLCASKLNKMQEQELGYDISLYI